MIFEPLIIPTYISLALFFKYGSHNKINDKIFLFLLIFIFSLLSGCRDKTAGTDTITYIKMYDGLHNFYDIFFGYLSWKGAYFFSFIAYMSKYYIYDNYHIFLFTISCLSITFLIMGLYKIFSFYKIKHIFLYIVLFFMTYFPFLMYTNTIRQGLAISLVIYALSFLQRKKYLYYYILIILAIFSHKSSIAFIFFPLFFNYNSTYKYLIIPIFLYVIKYLIIKILIHIPFIGDKIIGYSHSFYEIKNIVIVASFSFMVYLVLNKHIMSKYIRENIIFNFFFFILIISILFIDIPKISGRFLIYAAPVLPYVLLNIFVFYKQRKEIKQLIILSFILLSYIIIFLPQVQINLTSNIGVY